MLTWLIIGAISGWIAGELMHMPKRGFIKTMAIGVVGSFVGGAAFRFIGFYAYGIISNIIVSVVGACLFLFVAKKIFYDK